MASNFREISCVVLGTILGTLIGIPATAEMNPAIAAVLMTLFSLIGGLIGYRRRRSVAFMYFCFAAILSLACIITFNLR